MCIAIILIVILIVIVITILFAGYTLIKAYREMHHVFDESCKLKGFEEATDYKQDWNDFQVECDKKGIIHVTRYFRCVKVDKWGDCIKKKRGFEPSWTSD